jgi:hypothetical protein
LEAKVKASFTGTFVLDSIVTYQNTVGGLRFGIICFSATITEVYVAVIVPTF